MRWLSAVGRSGQGNVGVLLLCAVFSVCRGIFPESSRTMRMFWVANNVLLCQTLGRSAAAAAAAMPGQLSIVCIAQLRHS